MELIFSQVQILIHQIVQVTQLIQQMHFQVIRVILKVPVTLQTLNKLTVLLALH